ncbi:MAG: hypothetical protein L6V92_10485 [Phocaeicola vulgatus]|nr:MAG: hypothetical protein L6V92_10485 [Phocaeicola vulgatus]
MFTRKQPFILEKTTVVFKKTLDVFEKTLDVFEQSLPRVVFGMLGTPEEIPAVIVDIKYVFSRL